MQNAQHLPAAQEARLNSLVARHEALSKQIEDEQKYPAMQEHMIKKLKLEKLRLKEKIERLS